MRITMRNLVQFIGLAIALLLSVQSWGQGCKGVETRLTSLDMVTKPGSKSIFEPVTTYNLKNIFRDKGEMVVGLRISFKIPEKSPQGVIWLEMNLPKDIVPVENGNRLTNPNAPGYPEGWNISNWLFSTANHPNGKDGWPSFKRLRNDKTPDSRENADGTSRYFDYTIRFLRSAITDKIVEENDTEKQNNLVGKKGGNPGVITFKLTNNLRYRKNITIRLDARVQKTTAFVNSNCNIALNRHIRFTIDLIRPTFPSAPADQTFKVDEPLEIQLSAEDRDEQNQKIPQKLKTDAPTDPLDIRHEHIEDGVFTSVVSVKKLHPLAGGGTEKEDRGITLPRGLHINQFTQKIEGTPTEEGTFEISMTTTDAAGNGQQEGNGTPQNWNSTPQTFTLTITPRMGLVNPNMRMRVAQ